MLLMSSSISSNSMGEASSWCTHSSTPKRPLTVVANSSAVLDITDLEVNYLEIG